MGEDDWLEEAYEDRFINDLDYEEIEDDDSRDDALLGVREDLED